MRGMDRRLLLPLFALVGCPWVGSAEHDELQKAWLSGPEETGHTGVADTDVDTDTDTDVDTDTDTDTDTDVDCTDDGQEDNDVLSTAAFVPNDYPIDATLCPSDGGNYGQATDVFSVVTGADNLAVVTIGADDCSTLDLRVEVVADDVITAWTRARGSCPTLIGGGYGLPDSYVRVVSESNAPMDYTLTASTQACADVDNDGYLASACGGPDCDDSDGAIHPQTVETASDGIDQDCDGGDLLAVCGIAPDAPTAEADTLRCGDLVSGLVWDRWVVADVPSNACVAARIDNLGDTEADPLLRIRDRRDSGRSFDNEVPCVAEPWTTGQLFPFDQQCPGGGVRQTVVGDVEIWVAQIPDPDGPFCPDDAPYGIVVEVDNNPVTPTLVGDDVAFE